MADTEHTADLTRRAFATGITGALAILGGGGAAGAAEHRDPLDAADMHDAALRGLARSGDCGDPVLAEKVDAVLARLRISDPEGAALVQIYRLYDVASAVSYHGTANHDPAATQVLALLHDAIRQCRAVSFRYTDLEGAETARTVLPLVLVHPPQGIKLLAWCEKRQDSRQFFVRAIAGLTPQPERFPDRRLALLRHLEERGTRSG